MAIWEKCTITDTAPGSRIDIDGTGPDWVRVLSPKFRLNDGSDYGIVGFGAQIALGTYAFTNTEASDLVARMDIAPNNTRQGHIDTLVGSLKTAGVWTKLDCFYAMAAADAQSAQLNWKSSSYGLTPVNGPTFTVDRGYAGDGSTSYLDSGFNPATAGGMYALNSAHMGVVMRTADAASSLSAVGNTNSRIGKSSTSLGMRSNNATNSSAASASVPVQAVWSRSSAIQFERYRNGVAFSSPLGTASAALVSENFTIGNAAGTFTTNQVAAVFWGASLTGTEVADLHTALSTYLTAVGAA